MAQENEKERTGGKQPAGGYGHPNEQNKGHNQSQMQQSQAGSQFNAHTHNNPSEGKTSEKQSLADENQKQQPSNQKMEDKEPGAMGTTQVQPGSTQGSHSENQGLYGGQSDKIKHPKAEEEMEEEEEIEEDDESEDIEIDPNYPVA